MEDKSSQETCLFIIHSHRQNERLSTKESQRETTSFDEKKTIITWFSWSRKQTICEMHNRGIQQGIYSESQSKILFFFLFLFNRVSRLSVLLSVFPFFGCRRKTKLHVFQAEKEEQEKREVAIFFIPSSSYVNDFPQKLPKDAVITKFHANIRVDVWLERLLRERSSVYPQPSNGMISLNDLDWSLFTLIILFRCIKTPEKSQSISRLFLEWMRKEDQSDFHDYCHSFISTSIVLCCLDSLGIHWMTTPLSKLLCLNWLPFSVMIGLLLIEKEWRTFQVLLSIWWKE